MRPRLGVSSCLLGEQVRFDGGHKRHRFCVDVLRENFVERIFARARLRELFGTAMAGKATRGRHTNALLHAFSQVSERLDDTRRTDLVDRIHAYRRGDTTLSVPIALLTHHARGDGLARLAEQSYLTPYPAALRV
jgi:uncharacterized protein YbgA (DUF1722 family)